MRYLVRDKRSGAWIGDDQNGGYVVVGDRLLADPWDDRASAVRAAAAAQLIGRETVIVRLLRAADRKKDTTMTTNQDKEARAAIEHAAAKQIIRWLKGRGHKKAARDLTEALAVWGVR